MKTYNEMANTVLKRIDEYETKRLHKKAVMKKAATGLSCVCIAAMIGIGAWQVGSVTSPLPQSDTSSAVTETTAPKSNDTVVINRITDEVPDGSRKMNICLLVDDYVPMNNQQLAEYYGLNIFPAVPADLKEETDEDQNEDFHGIYKRDGGKGEVYYDVTILNYSNEDFSRSVNIELQTGSLPFSCYAFFDFIKNESVINGVNVKIAQDENGDYYASFMHKNVGFRIFCGGLSQDEFVSVIASLTD